MSQNKRDEHNRKAEKLSFYSTLWVRPSEKLVLWAGKAISKWLLKLRLNSEQFLFYILCLSKIRISPGLLTCVCISVYSCMDMHKHTWVLFRWSQTVCICDDNSHAIPRRQHFTRVLSIFWLSQSFCFLWCSLGLEESDIGLSLRAEHSTLFSALWPTVFESPH